MEGAQMVTFMIGNGFDIQVGLNTRYTDFYKVYTKDTEGDSDNIKRFKSEILGDESNGWETWADWELQMGIHSKEFPGENGAELFLECFGDFIEKFMAYLTEQCEMVDWIGIDVRAHMKKFSDSVLFFYSHITSENKYRLKQAAGKCNIFNFLQFNYTKTLQVLLDRSNNNIIHLRDNIFGKEIIHIHGKSDELPTMGVDNVEQILDPYIRTSQRVQRLFVKPNYLDFAFTDDLGVTSPISRALETIKNSKVIVAFGCSMGDTDKFWWKAVGEWLIAAPYRYLVIFDVCHVYISGNRINPVKIDADREAIAKIASKKEERIQKFCNVANINADFEKIVRDRIIIQLNSTMFDFKLPKVQKARLSTVH
jgi:hypothetical protein